MFGLLHIPDAVTVVANFTGWHAVLALFMSDKRIAKMYYDLALKPMYANRSWPEKPLLLWLPSGRLWRVYDDGTVEKFDRSMMGPKSLGA